MLLSDIGGSLFKIGCNCYRSEKLSHRIQWLDIPLDLFIYLALTSLSTHCIGYITMSGFYGQRGLLTYCHDSLL